jgi:hypothetical protein
MAYMRNDLIARRGYSGVGDIWDTITGAAGSVLKFYGTEQQAQGAAAATAQANRDLTAALMAQQGPGMGTILLLGGVGVVAYLLLSKKKKE